jgi:hypothetical protein
VTSSKPGKSQHQLDNRYYCDKTAIYIQKSRSQKPRKPHNGTKSKPQSNQAAKMTKQTQTLSITNKQGQAITPHHFQSTLNNQASH